MLLILQGKLDSGLSATDWLEALPVTERWGRRSGSGRRMVSVEIWVNILILHGVLRHKSPEGELLRFIQLLVEVGDRLIIRFKSLASLSQLGRQQSNFLLQLFDPLLVLHMFIPERFLPVPLLEQLLLKLLLSPSNHLHLFLHLGNLSFQLLLFLSLLVFGLFLLFQSVFRFLLMLL